MTTRFTDQTKIQIRALLRDVGLRFDEPRNEQEQWRIVKTRERDEFGHAGMPGEWALARAIRQALKD